MTRYFCILGAMIVVLTGVGAAQVDEIKLNDMAHAIARAEGFGVKGTIPTRYHNPGDIRSSKLHAYKGQIGLNKCGYVIFKNDRYGFLALEANLEKMASGQSAFYGTNMTIIKVAKIYSTDWKTWSKNVAKVLGVTPSTTLKQYFAVPVEPEPIPFDTTRTLLLASYSPAIQ